MAKFPLPLLPNLAKVPHTRQVTIHQAKTQLSKLIAAAERGEEIIIARRDKPVVRLSIINHSPMPNVCYSGLAPPQFFGTSKHCLRAKGPK